MKIIHIADLHIDSKLNTHLNSNKSLQRRNEVNFAFSRVVDYAKTNCVDIILIAGDMFDSKFIKEKNVQYVLNIIKNNQEIKFVYLPGNHEGNTFIKLIDETISNLYVFDENIKSYEFNNVRITGIILNSETNDYIKKFLDLKDDKFNILTLHGQIGSSKKEIDLKFLADKNINYLALGHIHQFKDGKLGYKGVYVYPGCIEGRGFDETGEKGFVLLEINSEKEYIYKFIPFSKRKLHNVEIDISLLNKWEEIEREIEFKIQNISNEDMVRVTLVGTYQESLIKQNEMLNIKLNDKFYFAQIKDETSVQIDVKNYENEISLKSEFIKLVLTAYGENEEKDKIIEYGIKALKGEEL